MTLADIFIAHSLSSRRIDETRRQLKGALRRRIRRQGDTNAELRGRIEALEDDLGYVTLVLAAVLCRLDEQGTVTQDDVRSLVAELDDVDGVKDGRLDVNLVKELTSE